MPKTKQNTFLMLYNGSDLILALAQFLNDMFKNDTSLNMTLNYKIF